MAFTIQRPPLRQGVAIASVSCVFLSKLLFDHVVGESPSLLLFLFAVTLTAWYGGLVPGLTAVTLSAFACEWLRPFPAWSPEFAIQDRAFRLVVFVAEGGLISALMEALHAARHRADLANLAKDRFLATLSHELRTPLTPVLLTAAEMRDDPETPARLRPVFETIRRDVELETRLIDDLLDVTRIVSGKLPYHFESLDVHEVVYLALDVCRHDVDAKGLQVVRDLAAIEHHVRGDPTRLQQLVWNLLKNAAKFTPEEGRITVRSRNENQRLVLEVADSGIGIEPATLPAIFEAFEQGDESVTRRFGGLGLGLVISRSIAVAHGGELTAYSPGRNQGSTFRLELATVSPPEPRQVEPPDRVDRAALMRRKLKLLLVEDDAPTAKIMAKLLDRDGYVVTTAGSVAEAFRLPIDSFDVVVTDLGLPDGSGMDLMRQISRRHNIPGIALTGYGGVEDFARSREAGFVAHLIKPVDYPTLDATIQRVALKKLSDVQRVPPGSGRGPSGTARHVPTGLAQS
jgi:signal transduction histidine kinase/ActR/RegA family two-component response regulator